MGGLPMTQLVFHHEHRLLPRASENLLPVQLYGLSGQGRGDISIIGNPAIDRIKRLGVKIPAQVMDFLSIALAVTAADTFVQRESSEDGWTRQLSLRLPLHEPSRWIALKKELESALHFLSGDIWDFEFCNGGYAPPEPYSHHSRFHLIKLKELDCVSLFSGGLDSAIGAIDLLTLGRAPLLVSHAYKGDKSRQDQIAERLNGRYSRFEINADPHLYQGVTDITMRTRSLNFLAFAAVGACAVQEVSQQKKVDLFVPENGFISLNAPLTPRRIGTLSTRTTHPYFISSIQKLFDAVGIPCQIINPYQFKTKGQMVSQCLNKQLLSDVVESTVSCSHWKRTDQQCGVCVPCIIRRASLHAGGISRDADYTFQSLAKVMNEIDRRDDLIALRIAIAQRSTSRIGTWIAKSGPLPVAAFNDFKQVFLDGLNEVENYLMSEGIV
ncbi:MULTISPECIES: Qat anti-phage system QueC-like protein QatC [Enterobacteriaceae]|uniref:7-cyano-7-deazaguanine synthase n=1 Tax=Citrobacter freundii TaxID=546 RepID=A0AAE7GWW0_CITFR|nr:Qat anti-phage system QueC-like protein QatC [Enterobacter kobei]EJX7515468.1 7-cyano-7-deazaguanine synthase [Escherichia coli]QLO15690.1 7-cyano-7-deazaguanine synthase [Citrobacter freundii]QLZ43131.1 7-cyano-7-deazaguanine synthase [Citrobacter sp. RHBSTW-00127]EKJ4548679.1 7-cyano-7-deazaguanine synthase [Escherichia coli]MBO4158670.1 7-cyano-7-deazaguanine synthase [Enterobacter kobei]